MTFQIGQKIVVRSALGDKSSYGRGYYYHGGTPKQVPLGARAFIDRVVNSDKLFVRFEKEKYGDSGGWYVHPDELALTPEEIEKEREERNAFDLTLEEQLTEKVTTEVEEKTLIPDSFGRRLLRRTLRLFGRDLKNRYNIVYSQKPETRLKESPVEKKVGETREFNPRFNPREEFAVWLRQQFPDLPACKGYRSYDYSRDRGRIYYDGSYHFPEERRAEIKTAAKKACEHGIEKSGACISAYFRDCSDRLNKDFDGAVFTLLNLIENVSTNLPHGSIHYGTSAKNGGRVE